MAATSKENIGLSSSGALMGSDSLFKAFAPSADSRPPVGSRLVQYMQPQARKSSGTPVNLTSQNGPHLESGTLKDHQMLTQQGLGPPAPMNMGASTSFHSPPTQSFSHLNLSPHHTNEFVPGKMMHPSVSNPTFVESGHTMAFVPPIQGYLNSRDTPTPPVKARMNKSPVLGPDQPFVQESIGGTTYFYNHGEEVPVPGPFAGVPAPMHNPEPRAPPPPHPNHSFHGMMFPNFYSYQAAPSHLAHYRPKGAGIASYFTSSELKTELMERQLLNLGEADPEEHPDVPQEVENYQNIVALEPGSKASPRPGFFLHYTSTAYKGTGVKDALVYSLRRLHNCRLVNPRCLSMVDTWKKLAHTGVVQLREMCTTKCFGDYSLVFVYDFHPGAETLKFRHFSGMSRLSSALALYEEFDHFRGRNQSQGKYVNGGGGGGTLPESLIWTYVVQLSSALRAIHAAGLAARTMDPSKILVIGPSKLMISCCGIMDVLTFDQAQHNMQVAIQHYQQEDLVGLGRMVVALACSSLVAASRENLASSIAFVAQNYSQDLKNLVTRMRNINDIMPMIGARFYAQLDAAQARIDMLETEVSKEMENGRLFRLICKLGTINERPEYNLDQTWSETGDRYLLKLFRDYLFHQVTEDGRPWIDMAHVVQTLNKVEVGSLEKLSLMSRDEQNVLVVSYADLKRCLDQAFQELTRTT